MGTFEFILCMCGIGVGVLILVGVYKLIKWYYR